jgi:Spx/MgsR family transcriptional regulator
MITLYGIKNCDTVKKARKWLEAEGISYEFFDLKAGMMPRHVFDSAVQEFGLGTVLNQCGTTWRQRSEADQKAALSSADKAYEAASQNTSLLKRPLLVMEDQMMLGFKADQYERVFANKNAA